MAPEAAIGHDLLLSMTHGFHHLSYGRLSTPAAEGLTGEDKFLPSFDFENKNTSKIYTRLFVCLPVCVSFYLSTCLFVSINKKKQHHVV